MMELITESSVYHVFVKTTTSTLLDSSWVAHGNGYFESHRLITPASSAAGIFSLRIMSRVFRAFFSPCGRVLGRMGETVLLFSSLCSARKLQRQLTSAV